MPHWRSYCGYPPGASLSPAFDIVQPNVNFSGGFSRALAIGLMAKASGILSTPHCPNLSMLPLFSSHYLLTVENTLPYLEYLIEDSPITDDLFLGFPEVQNGKITPSDKAGCGVSVNPDWLKKSEYKISKVD